MRVHLHFFVSLFIAVASCDSVPEHETSKYENEIECLTNNEEKRVYLEAILELDQDVRNSGREAQLIGQYGYNSEEHMEFIEEQWRQDAINLAKVEAYLEEFGYPSKVELGKDAAITPWLVIHHSTDIGERIANFSILYKAYLTNDIDDIALSMYLERTYKSIHRESITMEDPYTTDQKIDVLIEKLGFEEEKVTVISQISEDAQDFKTSN